MVAMAEHHPASKCESPELVQRGPTLWPARISWRSSEQDHWLCAHPSGCRLINIITVSQRVSRWGRRLALVEVQCWCATTWTAAPATCYLELSMRIIELTAKAGSLSSRKTAHEWQNMSLGAPLLVSNHKTFSTVIIAGLKLSARHILTKATSERTAVADMSWRWRVRLRSWNTNWAFFKTMIGSTTGQEPWSRSSPFTTLRSFIRVTIDRKISLF